MNPFEKLLLRRARNTDLQRSAQWLANLTMAYAAQEGVTHALPDELGQTMEYYGLFAETEDPEAFMNAESELGRAIKEALKPLGAEIPADIAAHADKFIG